VSQSEVIDVLQKANKPLSRTEIAMLLNQEATKISFLLKKLLRGGDIKVVEINRKQAIKNYNCKRRMRIYYI